MSESRTVEDELAKYPAEASPPEVLELKPNKANPEGPHPQVSSIGYTTWTRPDGGSFVAPVSNDATYEAKGFKKGKTEDIPDFNAYLAEMAAKAPAKAEAPRAAPAKAS